MKSKYYPSNNQILFDKDEEQEEEYNKDVVGSKLSKLLSRDRGQPSKVIKIKEVKEVKEPINTLLLLKKNVK